MSRASPTETVTRIDTADAAAALERLAGSPLLERGSVFVLSVEAIRERSADRWPRKRDDVWGYLARKLDEHLSYQDIHHRIGETDCLVAMTTEEGLAAQAVGLKILEEVLEHFLGAAEHVDVRIKSVGRIEGDEITCRELDPARIATARQQQAAALTRQVSPEHERERNPVSFVAASGHRLRIDFALEPILSLRHGITAVVRVEPTVAFEATGEVITPRRFARLPDEDILAIDRATLAFGGLFIPEDARTQSPLVLPVSFRTMAARKGRQHLSTIPGVSPERVRQGVLIEFVDVDRGTPTGRLVEVTGLVGQLCRGVCARLQFSRDALEPIRGARFNGLSLDFAEAQAPDRQLAPLMRAMAHQMRGKAPALIATGLRHPEHLRLADAAGFTHAGVRTKPVTTVESQVA